MTLHKLVEQLTAMVKDNEWQTRHAAENRYCPFCATDNDTWKDQSEHHPGCEFLTVVQQANDFLHPKEVSNLTILREMMTALDHLWAAGLGESAEADMLRDRMDKPWYGLTQQERDEFQQRPTITTPQPQI